MPPLPKVPRLRKCHTALEVQFSSLTHKSMAQETKSAQISIRKAQHKIFITLCVAYRRSRQDPETGVRADALRRELDIPETLFAEALDTFTDATGQMII